MGFTWSPKVDPCSSVNSGEAEKGETLFLSPGICKCGLGKKKRRVSVMSKVSKCFPKRMILGAKRELRAEGVGRKGRVGVCWSASRVPSGRKLPLHSLFFGHAACRILVPQPGIEPHPLHWKHRVLITGPPGKSHLTS